MADNPTDCCGVSTNCCGTPLKDRLTATVQCEERQSSATIAYDVVLTTPQVWKGDTEIPLANSAVENLQRHVELSIRCELGEWILHVNGIKKCEASDVECDPLLLEFNNIDLEGLGNGLRGRCSIYVTE